MPCFLLFDYICELIKLIKQNTMEKIQELIKKLDNTLPTSFEKRLDGYNKLFKRLELAKSEHNTEPTDESTENLAQIQEYFDDVTNDLIEDLEELMDKKETPPAPAPQTPETPAVEAVVIKEEKKEGMSVLGIVLGGVLLVGSLGAINYFTKGK